LPLLKFQPSYVLSLCTDLSLNYVVWCVKADKDSESKERVKRDESKHASANLQDNGKLNRTLH